MNICFFYPRKLFNYWLVLKTDNRANRFVLCFISGTGPKMRETNSPPQSQKKRERERSSLFRE